MAAQYAGTHDFESAANKWQDGHLGSWSMGQPLTCQLHLQIHCRSEHTSRRRCCAPWRSRAAHSAGAWNRSPGAGAQIAAAAPAASASCAPPAEPRPRMTAAGRLPATTGGPPPGSLAVPPCPCSYSCRDNAHKLCNAPQANSLAVKTLSTALRILADTWKQLRHSDPARLESGR